MVICLNIDNNSLTFLQLGHLHTCILYVIRFGIFALEPRRGGGEGTGI